MTGYLTQRGKPDGDYLQLVIPNEEIRKIFKIKIYEWFKQLSGQNHQDILKMCEALENRDIQTFEGIFNNFLEDTISIRDNNVPIDKKENFYHGILLGLLSYMKSWIVKSNVEAGYGYSDILIKIPKKKIGIVIEVKFGDNKDMEKGCQDALQQIEEKNYAKIFEKTNMRTILKYGIACYMKECKVKLAE